jgi:hypothetical protein
MKGEGLINFDAMANISRQSSLEFINRNPCPSLELTIVFVSLSCLFHASWYTVSSLRRCGHEQLIFNGGRFFKSAFAERDKKQTMKSQ